MAISGNKKMLAAIAAGSLLVVGAVTAAVMTGVIPYSPSKAKPEVNAGAQPAAAAPTSGIKKQTASKTTTPANKVANTAVIPVAKTCADCGVIEFIERFTEKGQATGGGAIAGGLVGGIVGHQIGKGRGKDLATVAGAVGGAIAGHEIEKNANKVERYRVGVRMNDGTSRQLILANSPNAAVGDRIRIVNGELIRD